jgi:prepilin-type N-terminal cleavage/methylation domain-containing protein
VFKTRRFGDQDVRGFSLIEMLVASAVFAIAAAVAFILYTAAQKSYKSGENFTDQQQATRVAFDRLISDLRLAGFNSNPDGDSTRIDEQIEGAWDTAVTFRGDFDFEDPAASLNPETSLPGTAYNVVSTGNDEIVTYVLAKPGSGDTLALRMDVDKPRTKTLKDVTISGVAHLQSNPPYTLYRVSLADVTVFPSTPPNGTSFVFEPVAENIRTLTFQYYDDAGVLLNPDTPAVTVDDIGGSQGNVLTRGRIRRIAVNLVGMTADEDPAYIDTSDALAATQHFRKFDLQSDVNIENLGRSGVKDVDITPPPAPTNVTLVPGHCKGVLVKWDQPSSTAGVTAYGIKFWPNGSPSLFSSVGATYPHIEYGILDYDGHSFVGDLTAANYCFQVQAKDSAGNQSGWAPSTAPCVALSEASTPGTPQNVAATGSGSLAPLDGQIRLTWDEVKSNIDTVSGDPDLIGGGTIMRDTMNYRVTRALDALFTLSPATTLLGPGSVELLDPVANCRTYHYKVEVIDKCNVVGAASSAVMGQAVTIIPPAPPTGITANRTNRTTIGVTWAPVTTNVDGTSTVIDLYKVYRAKALTNTNPASIPSGSYTLRGTSTTTTYSDILSDTGVTNDVKDLNSGFSFFYVVSAADLCGNESAKSNPVEVFCTFSGSLTPNPADNSSNGGNVPMSVLVTGEKVMRARVRVPTLADPSADAYFNENTTVNCVNPPCNVSLGTWSTASSGPGAYTVFWEVENDKGCISALTTTFNVTANLACQITPTNPNLSPTSGKPGNQNKSLSWDIINNSGKDLEILSIEVSWTNVLGPHTLTQLDYPTGTAMIPFTCTKTLSTTSDATVACGFPLGLAVAQATNMALTWDLQIVDTSNVGENVTIKYNFQDTSLAIGSCQFTVKPDLTIQ